MHDVTTDAISQALALAQVSSLTRPSTQELEWSSTDPVDLRAGKVMVHLVTVDPERPREKSRVPLPASLVPVLAAWQALQCALHYSTLGTEYSFQYLPNLQRLLQTSSITADEGRPWDKHNDFRSLAETTPRGMVFYRKLLSEAIIFLQSKKLQVQENSLARLTWAEENGINVQFDSLSILESHADKNDFRPVREDLKTVSERTLRQAVMVFGTYAVPVSQVQPHTWNKRTPLEMVLLDYATLPGEFDLRTARKLPTSEAEWDVLLERFDAYLQDPLGSIENLPNRESKRTRALFTPSCALDLDLFLHKKDLPREVDFRGLSQAMLYRWASIHGEDLTPVEAHEARDLLNPSYRLLLERNLRAHTSESWQILSGSVSSES